MNIIDSTAPPTAPTAAPPTAAAIAPTTAAPTTVAQRPPPPVPIPVVLIGGFLGAGKTTLVNHLIRQAQGRRVWVLVNDFGELPIDADLIESRDDQVIRLTGGCVCCSYGSDLISTLKQISEGDTTPDILLLETSGVSLPEPILMSMSLLPNLAVRCTVVMADACAISEQLRDRYVSDTVAIQLQSADLIGLNKTDLVSDEHLQSLVTRLSVMCPSVPIHQLTEGRLDSGLVFGVWPPDSQRSGTKARWRRPAEHTSGFFSVAVALQGHHNLSRLSQEMAELAQDLVRAKVVALTPEGVWQALHFSGSGWRLSTLTKIPARAGAIFIFKAPKKDTLVLRGALRAALSQVAYSDKP